MNLEQIFIAALGAVCGALGWSARELYGATQALRRDLSALEVKLGTDYVRYDRLQDRLREALEPIKDGIDEIRAALKDKADKS